MSIKVFKFLLLCTLPQSKTCLHLYNTKTGEVNFHHCLWLGWYYSGSNIVYWSSVVFLVCIYVKNICWNSPDGRALGWRLCANFLEEKISRPLIDKTERIIDCQPDCIVNFWIFYSLLLTLLPNSNKDCFHLSSTQVTWTILQAVSQRKDVHMPRVYICAALSQWYLGKIWCTFPWLFYFYILN